MNEMFYIILRFINKTKIRRYTYHNHNGIYKIYNTYENK